MSSALVVAPTRSTRRSVRQAALRPIIEAIRRYEARLTTFNDLDAAWIANPSDIRLDRRSARANELCVAAARRLTEALVTHGQPVRHGGAVYRVEPWTEFEGSPLGLMVENL